jgi:hypothetical protein
MHAVRASVSTTLSSLPGALFFGRDMFLNIPLIADWNLIAQRREQLVNESLRRQNLKRRRYDYIMGQRVLKKCMTQRSSVKEPKVPTPLTLYM